MWAHNYSSEVAHNTKLMLLLQEASASALRVSKGVVNDIVGLIKLWLCKLYGAGLANLPREFYLRQRSLNLCTWGLLVKANIEAMNAQSGLFALGNNFALRYHPTSRSKQGRWSKTVSSVLLDFVQANVLCCRDHAARSARPRALTRAYIRDAHEQEIGRRLR